MAKDFKAIVEIDVSTDQDADADELHDALMDRFDVTDLEGEYESTVYDNDGNETDRTVTISFNVDTVRHIEVTEVEE